MRWTYALLLSIFVLPPAAHAADAFDADAAFLGEIDTSRAPPVTRKKGSELGVDGQLAFARELSKKGLPEAALAFLRHAARENPDRADVWYQLATTLEAAQRKDEAAVAFDRYLAMSPTYSAQADRGLRRRADPDWSPVSDSGAGTEPVASRPTVIRVPDPEPRPTEPTPRAKKETRVSEASRSTRVAHRKPNRPPPERDQINGMLEILGER